MIFVVEGIISAGKDELINSLEAVLTADGYRVCVVPEPVDQWQESGALGELYEDIANGGQKKFAYDFQTYAFSTQTQQIQKYVAANKAAGLQVDIYLLNRTPLSSRVFSMILEKTFSPAQKNMYTSWCDTWQEKIPLDLSTAKVLYLRPSIEECMSRLINRGRGEEKNVDIAYEEQLKRAHDVFFSQQATEEFPRVPMSPYKQDNIIILDEIIAGRDFRLGKDEKAVREIISLMGL
jgi:thymidylate kinase